MSTEQNALELLQRELARKEKRKMYSFEEYLNMIRKNPRRILRSIFQLYYDMVKEYVKVEDGEEYTDDPEDIGFVRYDCSQLFVEGADNPFFADTPLANRFVRQAEGLRQGFQQNRVYAHIGPSGCGKSTFLNNLLRVFESYTNTSQGRVLETVWEIDETALLGEGEQEAQKFLVPCPSHDYPILLIPKNYRPEFLEELLKENTEVRDQIFAEKEYAWLFRGEACTICKSIFWALFERLGSLDKVLEMAKVRAYRFDRRTGEGISIFNPGDKPLWGAVNGEPVAGYFTNEQIQERLNRAFGINTVRYMYSSHAKTNNGIYALMDVKGHNEGRLLELHNIVSDGVHKVGDIEENIHSLFIALMNPEDRSVIESDNMKSFRGRIQYNNITYVLEPVTEANIYRNIFGSSIEERFLPRVLENFARVIISSRMSTECPPQQEWLANMDKYKRYCDEHGLLLRMELFSNNIPSWLSEEDLKSFTAPVRKAIIAEGQKEGSSGFSGRDSIALFSDFFGRYGSRENLINMSHVVEFFKRGIDKKSRDEKIPKNFLASLVDSYDYTVLNEMKEALYHYNRNQITRDILNYLCATSYDIGDTFVCEHTGDEVEVAEEFLIRMATKLSGEEKKKYQAEKFASEIQRKYLLAVTGGKQTKITETELYQDLFRAYTRNLKEEVLEPFLKNKNFREAIKAFDEEGFDVFDTRLKGHVSRMITNLEENFGYSRQGAKEICLYVLDNKLADKFSD